MLNDAVAAEAFRLWRNQRAWFWGFVFVPLVLIVFDSGMDAYLHDRVGLNGNANIGTAVLQALTATGSPFEQIFFALGAAGIFAADYQNEAWRLIIARNARANLIAAKFIVYAMAAALGLLAIGCTGFLDALCNAFLNHTPPGLPSAMFALQTLGVFAVSWLELLLLGAVAGFIAVASRSGLAGTIAAIMFAFVQSIAQTPLSLADTPLKDTVAVPYFSDALLQAFVEGRMIAPGVFVAPADAGLAAGILIGWIVVVSAAAFVLFRFQELPRE